MDSSIGTQKYSQQFPSDPEKQEEGIPVGSLRLHVCLMTKLLICKHLVKEILQLEI